MTTAAEQINGAYRLLNVLDQTETANATQLANGLLALNQMLDSWSTERLSVFATNDQTFTWPTDTISRTLGPSGNFVGTRPILLDDSTYFVVNNISYGLTFINQEQYDAIALKASTSPYPQWLFINMDMPDITMYVWPKPTQALEMHFISVTPLTQPATSGTTLSIPPGYLRAFRFNLACEIAMELGVDAPASVKRIADVSKRNIKRINNPEDVMGMPAGMMRKRRGTYNVYADY